MLSSEKFDLSVVLLFADDEELIGRTIRDLVAELGPRGSFEIIAVDEDSRDNTHAVLAMLRPEFPELKVVHSQKRNHATEIGVARAQADVVVLVSPTLPSLPEVLASVDRVRRGELDVEVATGRFVVARLPRARLHFSGVRLSTVSLQRRFARRLAARQLRVRLDGAVVEATATRSMARFREAFAARRAS
jgi:glycosyltransferase involved in cell wall biosynthesis